MFGFFKSKTKDKVTNKEKNGDNSKEKKKEKSNKEDKEVKVSVRKGKDEKTSRSIFRKSKSIERVKEGNEDAASFTRKSQSFDSRDSGGWSDHEPLSGQDSGATEGEEATTPGLTTNSCSSDDAVRPSSPTRPDFQTQLKGADAHFNSISVESPALNDASPPLKESDEACVTSCCKENPKHDLKPSSGVSPTTQASSVSALAEDARRSWYSAPGGGNLTVKVTQPLVTSTKPAKVNESTTTLVMKPPLNPRIVAPRGPLATATTFINSTSLETNGEREDSRHTPSPGLVTPPCSPGLSSSQIMAPHQGATNSTSRPTSPDGRTSMLSTPSSSTSSLSSISARPISPSGRRTPPGPRMGTGGRLTSSPTAGRKAVRTNIITNPSVASRRAGSHSPVNSPPSPGAAITYADSENLKTPPSSPAPVRHVMVEQLRPVVQGDASPPTRCAVECASKVVAFSPPIYRRGLDSQMSSLPQSKTPIPPTPGKLTLGSSPSPPPTLSPPNEVKPEVSSPGSQRSVSPTVGKSRHSISSMHSLESIPENDSDGQSHGTNEKALNGKGKMGLSRPLAPGSPKEQRDSATRPTRHSAPEATPERPSNYTVTHKRSSSLTPVNEERRIYFSVSINEAKSASPPPSGPSKCPGEETLNSNALINTSVKNITEKLSGSLALKQDTPEKYQGTNKREDNKSSKEIHVQGKATAGMVQTSTSSSPAGDDGKLAGSNFPPRQPIIGSLARVNVADAKCRDANTSEVKSVSKRKITEIGANSKSSAATDEIQKEELTTHVVFRIPLKSSSTANEEGADKRVSVEVLSREEERVRWKEKEHRKERPRSLSTSRELRREKSSEVISRRRLPAEGTEGKKDSAATTAGEGKKEVTRERSRCRSSSSRRTRSQGTDQSPAEATAVVSNGNDSYDGGDEEVVIPWRKEPRSRSRVSRAEASTAKTINGTAVANSTSDPTTCEGVQREDKNDGSPPGNDDGSHSSKVTAPPRQRSKSRGPERRMTRSVTTNELKEAREGKTTSPERQVQRRARSTTRLRESRCTEGKRVDDTGKQVLEGGATRSRVPPRRRSLSTQRRSVSNGGIERKESTSQPARVTAIPTDEEKKKPGNKELRSVANLKRDETAPDESGSAQGKTENKSEKIVSNIKTSCNSGTERKSVQLQTPAAEVASKLCQTEEELELRVSQKELEEHTRKELGAQEERYQKQIDELTLSLAEKQEEVGKLTQTLETLKGAQETLANSEELQEKLSLLQQDVRDRNAQLDCARTELQSTKNDMEVTKAKLKKLEEDLDAARQKNLALQNQITATANCDKTEELEGKIKSLEEKLKSTEEERDKVSKTIDEMEAERDEEIKIIQDALDEAAQEREDLISTFQKEIQNMTTMNNTREQQLMEDFEWKLREMEKDHKKKMEERERKAEERISTVRNMVESELADSMIKVTEDRRVADEQLMEVGHLKSYEAEAIQLRGVTHELQKALRASAREMEHQKVREKILEEEIRGLKKTQPTRQNTLQRAKRQAEEAEAENRQKQEKMKNELNAEWEDKLRSECSRLKAELDELHAEEKHLAVESMKVQKEQEIRTLKQSWELRQEETTKEISKLKDTLTEKDAYYHKELENMRTNADRDVWELRRKLQRLDEKNWSQQELLQEKHHEELERLRADYKERVADLEARLKVALQNSDEEARLQAEKSHNEEMEHLCEQHRLSMERLREELEAEKFQAVEEARVIVSKHLEYVNTGLREQLAEAVTTSTQCREELEAVRGALSVREEVIKSMEDELSRLRDADGAGATSYKDSQSSIASSNDSASSQGSSNSQQDRLSLSESVEASIDSQDDVHKSGGSGLLGKMFGGNWFSSSKTKENSRRGSAPGKQSS